MMKLKTMNNRYSLPLQLLPPHPPLLPTAHTTTHATSPTMCFFPIYLSSSVERGLNKCNILCIRRTASAFPGPSGLRELHRWRGIGTARKKRRWMRWATGRSKRSSDLRALGIWFSSLCFLSVFSKCVLSVVRAALVPWCSHSALKLSFFLFLFDHTRI